MTSGSVRERGCSPSRLETRSRLLGQRLRFVAAGSRSPQQYGGFAGSSEAQLGREQQLQLAQLL